MYSYEKWNKPIQELIKMMREDYPNGFELRINSFSAELVNNQMVHCYVNEEIMRDQCCMGMEDIMNNLRNMEYQNQE